VFFVAGQRGEHRQATIEIVNHEAEPLRLESIEHPRERFATKLDTVERAGPFDPHPQTRRPGGKKTESILVKTSSGSTPLLTIPAHNVFARNASTPSPMPWISAPCGWQTSGATRSPPADGADRDDLSGGRDRFPVKLRTVLQELT